MNGVVSNIASARNLSILNSLGRQTLRDTFFQRWFSIEETKKFIESCRNLGIDVQNRRNKVVDNDSVEILTIIITRSWESWSVGCSFKNIIARLTRLFNLEKWDFKEVQRVGNDAWMRSPRMEDRKKREGKKNGGIRMRWSSGACQMIFYVYRPVYYGPKSETQLSPASTVRLPCVRSYLIPDHVLVPINDPTIRIDRYFSWSLLLSNYFLH